MIRISLLGQPTADVAGVAVQGIERTPKKLAILAYLALHPQQKLVSREALLSLFWPESPERPARHALSQTLHFIRQTFGADTIVTSGTQLVRLNPNAVTLDVRDFAAAIDRSDWQSAVQLYRGDLLEGLTLDESDAADWLDRERQRLRARAADALWRHALHAIGAGDADGAALLAERALACDPTREPACLGFLQAAVKHGHVRVARTIATSFSTALTRATGGDSPSSAFVKFAGGLRALPQMEPAQPVEAEAASTSSIFADPKREIKLRRPAWRRVAASLALVGLAALVIRMFTVRAAAGSAGRIPTMQFVIQPIEAPEELRPFADGIAAHMAGALRDLDWNVVSPGPGPTTAQADVGYDFEARAYRAGEIAQLSYQVLDVASRQVVTAGVLPFAPHSNVVDLGKQLIKKIRLEIGRSHPIAGKLSARERAAWGRMIHQQSLADSLRNAGNFKAAAQAYGALDSLYRAERWSARSALLFGIQRVEGLRAFVFSEYFNGNLDGVDSLLSEAEVFATDLMRRFPEHFEAREARGLVRYRRIQLMRSPSLAHLNSAIADLRPATQDGGGASGLTALAGLLLRTGDFAGARTYALAAQKRDVFLENEDENMTQLFDALFNLGEDGPARVACNDINDRFPLEGIAVACRLDLMGWSETEPLDLAEARRIVREGNASDPPFFQASMAAHSRLLLAAVLVRAGETAEARQLTNNVDISTHAELIPIKAAVLARLGDSTRARELAAGYAMRSDIIRTQLEAGRMFKGLLPAR